MPYVAVHASVLAALDAALDELERARRDVLTSAEQLGALSEDLCEDAVLRLEDRGAAPPQIASYRDGLAFRRDALEDRLEALTGASRALRGAVAEVRGFNGVGSDRPS